MSGQCEKPSLATHIVEGARVGSRVILLEETCYCGILYVFWGVGRAHDRKASKDEEAEKGQASKEHGDATGPHSSKQKRKDRFPRL